MKHQYALIRENDPQTFANQVNTAMNDGWIPVGGVAMSFEAKIGPLQKHAGDEKTLEFREITNVLVYAQAMARRGVNGVDIAT